MKNYITINSGKNLNFTQFCVKRTNLALYILINQLICYKNSIQDLKHTIIKQVKVLTITEMSKDTFIEIEIMTNGNTIRETLVFEDWKPSKLDKPGLCYSLK